MKRYKIAQVCNWYAPNIGGVEIHLQELANELTSRGHEVQVITCTPGFDAEKDIRIHRLKLKEIPFYQNVWPGPQMMRQVREILEREKFDVVQSHSFYSPLAFFTMNLTRKMGIPSVFTNHSLLRRPIHSLPLYRATSKYWAHWPDVFTAVSHATAEDTAKATNGKKVFVVPNGIHPHLWHRIRKTNTNGPIKITSVMRLTKRKKCMDLLKAIPLLNAELKNEKTKPHITIVGDGPERPRIENYISRHRLNGQVELLGFQNRDQIQNIFKSTDLFVLPSSREAMGIAILEARCAGIPVVAMNRGGVGDVLTHGQHGYLANNPKEFVTYIAKLVKDANLRFKMSEDTQVGLDSFSWNRVIDQFIEVYQLAIHHHSTWEFESELPKNLPYHRYGTGLPSLPSELSRD